jgi:argonaute-like protein implicated in RNA metabolism and viral defense
MLLFCGEDFNNKLAKGEYQIFEGKEKHKEKIDSENIIDFANYQNSNLEVIKGKLSSILIKEEIKRLKSFKKNFSIV